MLKICVLEDESLPLERMKAYLHQFQIEHSDFEYMLETYSSAFDLLEHYSRDVDLLFLDIRVPDMSGMEAAKRIREIDQNVMILFVTNLTQYAIEGYSVNAFDYILKPLAYNSFSSKLERALRMLSYRSSDITLDLRTRDGGRRVFADSITYIEISNHDIIVHVGAEQIRQWGTLSKFEAQLREAHFVRCNSSYLVNLKYVQKVRGDQLLVGGDTLSISRPRRKEFLNALAQYKGGSH